MNNEQIAHDLAIAKLAGTNLSEEEMVEKYYNYTEKFLNILNQKESTPAVASYANPLVILAAFSLQAAK